MDHINQSNNKKKTFCPVCNELLSINFEPTHGGSNDVIPSSYMNSIGKIIPSNRLTIYLSNILSYLNIFRNLKLSL